MSRYNYYNVGNKRDPRRLEVQAAATSARAFIPERVVSTPPSPPLDRSRYPHLVLVDCAPYGTVTRTTCEARWHRANKHSKPGQGALDASDMQLSACRGCRDGAERCGRQLPAKHEPAATKPCVRCGDPIARGGHVRCEPCSLRENERDRERNRAQRRVWGRNTTEGGPGGHGR